MASSQVSERKCRPSPGAQYLFQVQVVKAHPRVHLTQGAGRMQMQLNSRWALAFKDLLHPPTLLNIELRTHLILRELFDI